MNKQAKKLISSVLFLGIIWAQFPAGFALAFYNDIEISFDNILNAGIVDIEPTSIADFSPLVSTSTNAVRYITLLDASSTVPFQYKATIENANGTLCDYLNVEASLDGNTVYTGTLKNLSADILMYSKPGVWTFNSSLTSNDPSLQAQACTFDIVYKAWQSGYPEYRGLRDIERVPSIIRSDIWNGSKPNKCEQYNGEPGHLSILVSTAFRQPICSEEDIVYYVNCQSGEQVDCDSMSLRYASAAHQNYFHQITPSTSQVVIAFGAADHFAGLNGVVWQNHKVSTSSIFSVRIVHPTKNYLYAHGGDVLYSDCDGVGQRMQLNFQYIDDCESWSGVTTMPIKPKVIPPDTIVLNEVLPNPAGLDYPRYGVSGEWVEIYNKDSANSYNLGGFFLRDFKGMTVPVIAQTTMASSTVIAPNGYLVAFVPGGFMDNWGDNVSLLNRNMSVVDTMQFGTQACDNTGTPMPTNDDDPFGNCTSYWAQADKSIARFPDGNGPWVDPRPTPGAPNELTQAELEALEPATTTQPVATSTLPVETSTSTVSTTIPVIEVSASSSDSLGGGGGSVTISVPTVETVVGDLNNLLVNPPTQEIPTTTIPENVLTITPEPTPTTTFVNLLETVPTTTIPLMPPPVVPAAQDVQTPPAQEPNTELVVEEEAPQTNPDPGVLPNLEPQITPETITIQADNTSGGSMTITQ
jgi:hypothetical protein